MNLMRVAFRVDASIQIGTGHLMRCLALADSLKSRGARTRFICRHLPESLQTMLTQKGHEFEQLETYQIEPPTGFLKHSHWLGVSQEQDTFDTLRALGGKYWDWLIVDHYALDFRWESVLRQSSKHILVIDDLADRVHDCDALLDQNLYSDRETRYLGKVPAHCQMFLGPGYALLRDEFRQWRERVKPRRGPVKRILVFFGGVDADNRTIQAIQALVGIGKDHLHVDVIIGAQHPYQAKIESACIEHGFRCHKQATCMAELMAAADLAIGAGGSTSWERCCLGLPALTLCLAKNQQQLISDAASEGLLYALDPINEPVYAMARHATALIENEFLRQFISRRGMQTVDGRGVLRVIRHMGCLDVHVRPACKDDSRYLFDWRNHPSNRRFSRNAELIEWKAHESWFASVLTDPNRELLVGLRDRQPVGVVRFDVSSTRAEVSIYLVPGIDETGIGSELLVSAERWLITHRPDVDFISAQVLGDNLSSHRLFEAGGYQPRSTDYFKRLHKT
jgi:UDP-2,4-diacetamido-2,4,6-trideoxy-beta-L-altropyranose hydrolase